MNTFSLNKKTIAFLALGVVAATGFGLTAANAATLSAFRGKNNNPQHGVKPMMGMGYFERGPKLSDDALAKLAALFSMTPADLKTSLAAGTKLPDIATAHGVSKDELDTFFANQKQADFDALKTQLAAEVTGGKITQAQMDKKIQRVTDQMNQKKKMMAQRQDDEHKLAVLLNMSVADLETALKSGTKLSDIATAHGVTKEALDQFMTTQKQAHLNALKADLAAKVASGQITQVQMDDMLKHVNRMADGMHRGQMPMGSGQQKNGRSGKMMNFSAKGRVPTHLFNTSLN